MRSSQVALAFKQVTPDKFNAFAKAEKTVGALAQVRAQKWVGACDVTPPSMTMMRRAARRSPGERRREKREEEKKRRAPLLSPLHTHSLCSRALAR